MTWLHQACQQGCGGVQPGCRPAGGVHFALRGAHFGGLVPHFLAPSLPASLMCSFGGWAQLLEWQGRASKARAQLMTRNSVARLIAVAMTECKEPCKSRTFTHDPGPQRGAAFCWRWHRSQAITNTKGPPYSAAQHCSTRPGGIS